MFRKMIVSIAMLLLCGNTMAQPELLWENFYGYPSANNTFKRVVETPDGGFLGVGTTDVSSEQQTYLVKTDSYGNEVWSRTYSFFPTGQSANDAVLTQDSCYACCGTAGTDAFLFKVDANGDSLWVRLYDNGNQEYFNAMEQTEDGGFILAGRRSPGPNLFTNYLVRTDANGNEIWSQTNLVGSASWANWVHEADDGGFVITGYTNTLFSSEGFMQKVDASGDSLWTQIYWNPMPTQIRGACSTNDGGYGLLHCEWDLIDIWNSLKKTDADGNVLWNHLIFNFGDPSLNANSIDACDDEGFIIGVSLSDSGNTQGGLLKTDSLGGTIWSEVYGGPDSDGLYCVRQTEDGGYVAAGDWGAADNEGYAWLLRLASEGTLIDEIGSVPERFSLSGNYPNPFNASTVIMYDLPYQSWVTIDIYNILGQQVETPQNSLQPAGNHQTLWNAGHVPSGMYFYKLQAGDYTETRKMLLLK